MSAFVEIARTGCASIGRHPIRSAVTIAAVLSVLVPYPVSYTHLTLPTKA